MKECGNRSNFELMDEMEEKQQLHSKDTLVKMAHERVRLFGWHEEWLDKIKLTPLMTIGMIAFAVSVIVPEIPLWFALVGVLVFLAGMIEKILEKRK